MQTILDNTLTLENELSDDLLSTPPTLLQDPWATPAPPSLQLPSPGLEGLQPLIPLDPPGELPIVVQSIQGTSGDDHIEGTDAHEHIDGGDGNDYISSYEGLDVLRGGKGDDWLYNGWGDSHLYGDAGNDDLYGGGGEDELWGGDGNDILKGGWHNDRLYGGAGNDILKGSQHWINGSEVDILTGDYSYSRPGTTHPGEGADTFVLDFYYYDALYADFRAQHNVTPNGDGYAIITDFNRAEGDRIQVSGSVSDYSLQTGYDFAQQSPYTSVQYRGELIAIVQDITTLDLFTDFTFVS